MKTSTLVVIAADCASIALAQILSYSFRFEFVISAKELNNLLIGILFLIPLKLIILYWFGLYRGMWRYTGINDLINLAKANAVATLLIFSSLLLINRFHGLSRSIFLMDGIICFLLTSGFRVIIRLSLTANGKGVGSSLLSIVSLNKKKVTGIPTLLLGAGDAGESLLREIVGNPKLDILPVGFLDDSPRKMGQALHGYKVLGSLDRMKIMVDRFGVKRIFIAMPSATAKEMRRVVKLCDETGVPYKTLPGLGNLIDGSVSIKNLRDVNYEDLLGRPSVYLDDESISKYLSGKIILVTGAGGSIGSEICRQIIKYEPKRLVLLDHSELNLFTIESELKYFLNPDKLNGILGRVQHQNLMDKIFDQYQPQVIFHAAAFKHVPLVENNPWEGVSNNILGSKVVMETAIRHGVERFVLISTDKAVRPTNIMGACKRVTELLAQSMNGGDTKFMSVRFGNVVGSSGSVIPFFRDQIQRGGPVTVTHPEVTRYFMTIPEASKLVLQAGAIGNGGEIFVLEMGTPVKIMQMAEDLIRLSGKEPYKDIDIVVTGLREGEKLYEELVVDNETVSTTFHDKIMVLRPADNEDLRKSQEFMKKDIHDKIVRLSSAAERCDSKSIKLILKKIVPEYTP
ncbi:MAG: polysaccharide biosynthesis protein [Proteobacteria bacterium]|nr:polysaccharide biosynthesis protein [Pseudomonadota bacterium]MBU1451742.1 polysaccharide biosynthesis protein [Pseudomonadota bacterium]MBU2470644.1 polysaccharide biosynthesis protein [Pseudomonadota bacterium]MBU2517562.1 polysaccharide biosynthesis protein [Pseudomonadota bacterium]